METTGPNRPALPPIQFLDSNNARREERDHTTSHIEQPVAAPVAGKALSAMYAQGPPPSSFSASAQHHSNPTPSAAPHSRTPDSLSKRAELKDTPKHSLPSLHEALGVDRHAPYSSEGARPAATSTANPAPQTHSPPSPRKYQPGPSPPHHSQGYPQSHPPYSHAEMVSSQPTASESQEYRRPEYVESFRTYQHHSPPTPQGHRNPYTRTEAPRSYDAPVSQAPPPPAHFSHGYAHTSAPYPAAPAAPTAGPPPFHHSTIPQSSPDVAHGWRSGPLGPPAPRSQPYSESVKRHLDLYDFEVALNEIAEYSTITLDFSRQYGARLHQTQRSGPVAGTLPAITEIDDLMNKTRHTLDNLSGLRESLVAQQTAYFQQAQENLRLSQQDLKRDSVHLDESKEGGFAGSEPKKRRGRNAAPGRCHSCNRAETPEWRRGPDGARTLCNACGLHYAKLTRKAGANKAAIGGSSSRPKCKEDDD